MRSKGIDSSIDLTENGDFQRGVSEILIDREYKPGVLPWNETQKRTVLDDYVYSDIDLAINTWNRWVNYSDSLTTYDDSFYDAFDAIMREVDRLERLSTNPNDIIEYLKVSNFYVKGDKVFKSSPNYVSYCMKNKYSMWYDTITTNTSWFSISYNNDDDYTYYNKSFNDYVKDKDVTPKEYRNVNLSDDEMSGKKLITGENTKIKYEKYTYLKQVQSIITEFKSRQTEFIKYDDTDVPVCEICGKPIYKSIPGLSYSSKYCYECDIELYNNRHVRTNRSILDRYDNKFVNFHGIKMLGYGENHFEDQYIDGYLEGHDGVIDYYHQDTYTDRGVHLLRIPAGSHELRVNLGTGEFIDEEDEERNFRFSKPKLGYRRPETYKYSDVRRYLNRIDWNSIMA